MVEARPSALSTGVATRSTPWTGRVTTPAHSFQRRIAIISGRPSRKAISTPFTASVVAARDLAISGGRTGETASTARLDRLTWSLHVAAGSQASRRGIARLIGLVAWFLPLGFFIRPEAVCWSRHLLQACFALISSSSPFSYLKPFCHCVHSHNASQVLLVKPLENETHKL